MNLKINFAVCHHFLPCAMARLMAKLPFFAVCLSTWHTAKVALFAVCLGQGTRQRGCVCRVLGPGHMAKGLFNGSVFAVFAVCPAVTAHGKQAVQRGYASALYFAVGPIMHTAKCLPCARDVAHGKLALCRPLLAVSCLPCVTLGKHFAECKAAFAVCPWHTANRHSPVVTPP